MTLAELGIVLPPSPVTDSQGNAYTTCPRCSPRRRKKYVKCLSVKVAEGLWNCHHCGWGGTLEHGEQYASDPYFWLKDDYQLPHWDAPELDEKAFRWLTEERKISPEVLKQEQVGSSEVYFPQTEAFHNAIRFPFIKDGAVVNIKSLAYYKNEDGKIDRAMRLEARAERTFYGIDTLRGYPTWIIVEGEIDRLSVMTAGFPNVGSVPDGAPSPKAKNYQSKFDFLERDQEALARVKRFLIAVDKDQPGEVLQEELARRLGPERCYLVSFPDDCKDANDVLRKYGPKALANCLNTPKEYPVAGVFTVGDFEEKIDNLYERGLTKGATTGWPELDKVLSIIPGHWTPVTGAPGSGKTTWLNALLAFLAWCYGWRSAMFSPENQPLERHFAELAEVFIGKPFSDEDGAEVRIAPEELRAAKQWIGEHFCFILPDEEEDEATLDSILAKARLAVARRGIKILVIDPWNELEHCRPAHLTESEYIGKALTKIRKFARTYQVHVFVVAHPTKLTPKEDRETGEEEWPEATLYHISGSANWYNKADGGLVIWKPMKEDWVKVINRKVRFKEQGRLGEARLTYDITNGIFSDPKAGPYVPIYKRLSRQEIDLLLTREQGRAKSRGKGLKESVAAFFEEKKYGNVH